MPSVSTCIQVDFKWGGGGGASQQCLETIYTVVNNIGFFYCLTEFLLSPGALPLVVKREKEKVKMCLLTYHAALNPQQPEAIQTVVIYAYWPYDLPAYLYPSSSAIQGLCIPLQMWFSFLPFFSFSFSGGPWLWFHWPLPLFFSP